MAHKQQKLISHSSGSCEAQDQGICLVAFGAAFFLVTANAFSLRPHMVPGTRELWGLLYKSTSSIHEGTT